MGDLKPSSWWFVYFQSLALQNSEIGYVTAEKQSPNPISMAADIREAIRAEKQSGRAAAKTPLKDLLGKVVAEYNRLCTNKKHRIESQRRSLVYNLFLGP